MEDDLDNIFELCKAFYKNDDKIKQNNLDVFQQMDKDDYNDKKKIRKISYEKIYIIDKKPIEDIMNKLNFSEYESLFNEQDNKNTDDKIKNKIKQFMENNPSFKIKDDLQKIKFYSTLDEVNDVFNNYKRAYFIKEEYLKALGIQEKNFKNKFIYFSKIGYTIFLKFNESLDSLLIKISDIKKDENKTDDNARSNKKNNIINNEDDKDDKSDENDEMKNNINKNVNIISHHLNFLESINELKSIEIQDLKDITQINKILFDSNKTELANDCFLVDSEIFNKFEEEIYYNDCESITLINEEDREEKIEELINRMKIENKNGKFNNDIKIINDYEECYKIKKSNNDIELM